MKWSGNRSLLLLLHIKKRKFDLIKRIIIYIQKETCILRMKTNKFQLKFV